MLFLQICTVQVFDKSNFTQYKCSTTATSSEVIRNGMYNVIILPVLVCTFRRHKQLQVII